MENSDKIKVIDLIPGSIVWFINVYELKEIKVVHYKFSSEKGDSIVKLGIKNLMVRLNSPVIDDISANGILNKRYYLNKSDALVALCRKTARNIIDKEKGLKLAADNYCKAKHLHYETKLSLENLLKKNKNDEENDTRRIK
jgi:hypothetical protein